MKIEHDEQCKACGGTGLYVGLAERDGAAVVCNQCKGTGCYHFEREYVPFGGKIGRSDVKRVFKVNPGIVIGKGINKRFCLEDFGGIPYEDWVLGRPFPPMSENRAFTCPAWWYQSADYSNMPKWEECECTMGSSFSSCELFGNKEVCWKRWDREFGGKELKI